MIVVVRRRGGQPANHGRLGLAVANCIIGVMVVIIIGVVGFRQAVERVIDVVDGNRSRWNLSWCRREGGRLRRRSRSSRGSCESNNQLLIPNS